MMRTKPPKKADLILCSDFHLREDQPVCRTDDFWETQWRKVRFVAELQQRHECPVIHAGDLGHHWKWSDWLLSMAIINLPKQFFSIYGQHDLPQHSMELAYKSGMHTLTIGHHIGILNNGVHFGQQPGEMGLVVEDRNVLVWHHLVWANKKPWPGCTEPPAERVLEKYKQFDLIVTGDNHETVVVEKHGRLLVNPGSLMRQKSDQIDHKPVVFLWYADTNTVHPVYIPIETNVITREHIEEREQRDERIEAFITRLSDEWKVGVSFEENIDRWEDENHVPKSVMEIVRKAMES